MLTGEKLKQWETLLTDVSCDELIWMNGYLGGMLKLTKPGNISVFPQNGITYIDKLSIVYATETGNAKRLSLQLAKIGKEKKINTQVVAVSDLTLADLKKKQNVLFIISTQGDGEPPSVAQKLFDELSLSVHNLDTVNYSIIALGDTSYPLFCQAGIELDELLRKNGAKRTKELVKCDVDYSATANAYFQDIITASGAVKVTSNGMHSAVAEAPNQMYEGLVKEIVNLNDRGSNKSTFHIELETSAKYLPGDALSIIPENKEENVLQIIELLSSNREDTIDYKGKSVPLYELLKNQLNISFLSSRVRNKFKEELGLNISDEDTTLLHILTRNPNKIDKQEIISRLDPQLPRLYSIASAQSYVEGELHLTVGLDHFNWNGEHYTGLCSSFFSELKQGDVLNFKISKNENFRLPDAEKDIIMIAAGTGIAPFRSFIQERDALGASGRNWLFFGDQKFDCDFLYQKEWQEWIATELITQMNVAFSRDQEEKIYVQHKIIQHEKQFFQWLENGATIYICGSKAPMSVDVENTIVKVIQHQANVSLEEAKAYLERMEADGRYWKDVY